MITACFDRGSEIAVAPLHISPNSRLLNMCTHTLSFLSLSASISRTLSGAVFSPGLEGLSGVLTSQPCFPLISIHHLHTHTQRTDHSAAALVSIIIQLSNLNTQGTHTHRMAPRGHAYPVLTSPLGGLLIPLRLIKRH